MATRLIPIHKREYCLRNDHREAGEPEYFYKEILPAFYSPAGTGANDHHVWLTVPKVIADALHIAHTWDPASVAYQNGVSYVTAHDITKAEKLLQKANDEFVEWRTPKIRKKIILFSIRDQEVEIKYEILILVDNSGGKFYTLEHADGTKRYCSHNLYSIDDVERYVGRFIDWSPEAEAWFEKAKKTLDKIRHDLRMMLLKPNLDEKGKITGYGYFTGDDIKCFIETDTLPLQVKYTNLLEVVHDDSH